MKIKLSLILLLLVLCGSQTVAGEMGKFRIKFGVGASSAKIHDPSDFLKWSEFNSQLGARFGLKVNLFQKNNLAFYVGIEHQTRGSEQKARVVVKGDPSNPDIPTNLVVTHQNIFEYVTFDTGMILQFGNSRFRPFVNSGVSFSLLLRDESSFSDYGIGSSFDIRRFVFGINFGGGLVFAKLPPGELFLEVQYEVGLSNVLTNNDNLALPEPLSVKHRVISVSLGMLFP